MVTISRATRSFFLVLPFLAAGSLLSEMKGDSPADADLQYNGTELFERGAWCWFADPRAIRHVNPETGADMTWIGCIDTDGTVKALQYNATTGEEKEIVIDTDFQPDDHNNPTFLVLPDNRVMVFWSMHTAEPRFYYRVSENPEDLSEMSERKVMSVEGFGNYTYPSPFYLEDAPDSFFLLWRGVRWHPTIARYSLPDENGDIEEELAPTQIVQSTAARPYAKYDSNGKDRIFFAFTTGHPDNEMPNWLFYAELDVNTLDLYDVTGEHLDNVAESPFAFSQDTASGPLVVDNPSDFKNWVWDLARDELDRPVIAQVRITPDATEHNYFHSAWTGSEWRNTFLSHAGGWFHQHPRNAERCYSGGLGLDHGNPGTVYISVPTEGAFGEVYEIWKAEVDPEGNVARTQITRNSEKNNVRPYVIQNSGPENRYHLTWMHGDYYYWIVNRDNPLGFPTSLMAHDAEAWERTAERD
jgi:hypothetical protein